jgi:hypothetical protein
MVRMPTLNPPVRILSAQRTSPSQLSVSHPFISENILEGNGGNCLKVPSPITQFRHAFWPYTETMIWRRRNTRMKGLFLSGGLSLIGYRWSIVGRGGKTVKTCKDEGGAEIWTWNGMESVMAKIWAEGMKSWYAYVKHDKCSNLMESHTWHWIGWKSEFGRVSIVHITWHHSSGERLMVGRKPRIPGRIGRWGRVCG